MEVPNDWSITRRQQHLQPKHGEEGNNQMQTAKQDHAREDSTLLLHRKRKKMHSGLAVAGGGGHSSSLSEKGGLKDAAPGPLTATSTTTRLLAEKEEEEYNVTQDATEATANDMMITIENEDSKIVKGPMGPRSVFNAVTHDSPAKGQLRQIVMMHLSEKPPSGKNSTSTTTTSSSSSTAADRQTMMAQANSSSSTQEEAEQQAAKNDDMLQMEVHCLLSKLPYQKMISDLFSHHDKELLPSPTIPYVTRAYEESFMRERLNTTERFCAKGEQCECMFIDKQNPFICIEFLLPGERQPQTPHLCVVCCRAVTQQLYYDIMFDKHDFGGAIQRFGNIHSQQGEYALDAMLIAAPSVPLHIMPLPIVSHQRNRYSIFIKRGIKHLKQTRVYFQSTPSY